MRTILYARYSSDLQNPQSTNDQIDSLRERAAREGWNIVDEYMDEEISGRAGIDVGQRPGLNAMLARVERGDIDQVLAEATDRIARHGGDAHNIREHLEYYNTRLFTLADGVVDDITGAIKGLMDARFLKDLAEKIRRGQRGQHSRGFNPGGLAYGYRVVKPIGPDGEIIRGLLEINEDEAAIVRRIYEESIAGMSAYAIVIQLNAEGIPSPTGKKWRVSTILGDRIRAFGILRNNIYRGQLIYNRATSVYHHKTRRRSFRSNPLSEWRIVDVPHLRIVSDEQWDHIEKRLKAFDGVLPPQQRRRKRLLSGLGKCGVCGNNWIVVDANKWGCGERKARGGCTNTRTISDREYERRVLGRLKGILLDTESVELFITRYNAAIAKRQSDAGNNRASLERRATDARATVTRLVEAVASGGNEFPEIMDRLRTARADLAAIESELASSSAELAKKPTDLAERYRKFVAELDESMSTQGPARERAASAVRNLIDVITLTPRAEGRGVDIQVDGQIAEIINLAR